MKKKALHTVTYNDGPALRGLSKIVAKLDKMNIAYFQSIKVTEFDDGSLKYVLTLETE
ncbi:hypothetical protein MUK70_11910 [Dyadobacter chenwenxiniae]|uniref:Uncharacterized protein n=1 Tax=Dyadobacter chenwenxiniae TaxID=2906456 RepID=A0A9X1PEP8_9BACT|nr:hypothetical protein [Dyadobacter chenwenxiniae]MCF0059947.1 hypothetical protein [Dyadobacter chenwenxiniae]UON85686.1 hypothetical protein MUK70_11910 [Dyadobacter chenwenxiniae]